MEWREWFYAKTGGESIAGRGLSMKRWLLTSASVFRYKPHALAIKRSPNFS
jgi:hypothetical protein